MLSQLVATVSFPPLSFPKAQPSQRQAQRRRINPAQTTRGPKPPEYTIQKKMTLMKSFNHWPTLLKKIRYLDRWAWWSNLTLSQWIRMSLRTFPNQLRELPLLPSIYPRNLKIRKHIWAGVTQWPTLKEILWLIGLSSLRSSPRTVAIWSSYMIKLRYNKIWTIQSKMTSIWYFLTHLSSLIKINTICIKANRIILTLKRILLNDSIFKEANQLVTQTFPEPQDSVRCYPP